MHAINNEPQYQQLLKLSAREGANPERVQAAGGNTSIKHDGILWIKASGTWLQNALSSNIMVPVRLEPLLKALRENDAAADKAQDFIPDGAGFTGVNPDNLRPSIETTVHAVIPQKVVVHVHCVSTIALAIRSDAETVVSDALSGFNVTWVPYVKPGLTLSQTIQQRLRNESDVIVLGNHGLVVAAETVELAGDLLNRVCTAIEQPLRAAAPADTDGLQKMADGTSYRLPEMPQAHGVACDEAALAVAAEGSLYPDHVIFLGNGSVVAGAGESLQQVCHRAEQTNGVQPVSVLVPGKGVLMRDDATAGQQALARCLSDVCLRVPPGAAINYFSDEQNHELLNWDAEKYRQQLNKGDA